MSDIIIIPDIHEEMGFLDKIMKKYPDAEKYIFLGDWFDSFVTPESPHRAIQAAQFIKDHLDDPRYIFLIGNHDAHYRWRGNFLCSGYVYAKAIAIEQILTREDWAKFHVFYEQDGWVLSHAGFHKSVLPNMKWDRKKMHEAALTALEMANMGKIHNLFQAGAARGGYRDRGGCIWLDWNMEFKPVEGLQQIVGHTPGKVPRQKGNNWCLDTQRHVGILRDGKLTTDKVLDSLDLYAEEVAR